MWRRAATAASTTWATRSPSRTGRTRGGSRAACRARPRGRHAALSRPRVRRNASSWSAGSVPRPRPLKKHGTRRCSAAARNVVPGAVPVDVAADDERRAFGPGDQRGERGHGVGIGRHARADALVDRAAHRRPTGRTRRAGSRGTSARGAASSPSRAAACTMAPACVGVLHRGGRLRDRRHDRHVVELLQRARAPTHLGCPPAEHDQR